MSHVVTDIVAGVKEISRWCQLLTECPTTNDSNQAVVKRLENKPSPV